MASLEILRENEIIPDVLSSCGEGSLAIAYPSGKVSGDVKTPTLVKSKPEVVFPAEEGVLYTIIMTDPDAPSRQTPKFREWRHWTVVNIPESDVNGGKEIAEYVGAGPPPNTGLHRYVFILYKQKGKINVTEPILRNNSGGGRGKFKAEDFAKKYHLGEPIACTFFQAEYDDYVPTLYAQLSGK